MKLLYNKNGRNKALQIILITILGLILRLINIFKIEGLWNDEYVSWMTASVPFGDGFWTAVIKQCHMPFYYLYLKPFVHCSDLVLRLTSVVPSILAIPVMYLIGKEYSKKTGYFCAVITAILPFLVYYAQEVRFYSLVFLFASLSLLFTIKTIKAHDDKKNIILFGIFAILLILTHHLSIIYLLFISIYICYKRGINLKYFLITIFLTAICIIPIGISILKQLPSSQWWGNFSYTNLMFMFSDFFSPVLTNNINAPKVFYYDRDIIFSILITLPTLIAIIGICKAAQKAKGFISVFVLTVTAMGILAATGTVMFITKYMIEILPVLILLMVLGLEKLRLNTLIYIFILIQLISVFTIYYPAKLFRSEGHKIAGDILNFTKPDKVLFTYYAPDRFYRYWNKDAEAYHISKINRFEYIKNPAKILTSVQKGEKVSIVFLDSVSFIPPYAIDIAKSTGVPEMFITFSEIKNKLLEELVDNYKDYDVKALGSWTIITAVKK